MTQPAKPEQPESDESAGVEDNSLGRLLTLCDGVFAIAMTLLALDLKVPDLGRHAGDAQLWHALKANSSNYWSFLISFYVVASYWQRHRRMMRSVVRIHPRVTQTTMFLLLIVSAMPFLASLLGQDGSIPLAFALYGGFNAVAGVTLLLLDHDVRQFELLDPALDSSGDRAPRRQSWRNLGVFLLCIPAAFLFRGHAPWVLVLLAVPARRPRRISSFIERMRRRLGIHEATTKDRDRPR